MACNFIMTTGRVNQPCHRPAFPMALACSCPLSALIKKSRQNGEWLSFKTGLMILFTAFGLFIFFTQDALFQKMTGLLTSLISLTTQFSTLFDKSVPKSSQNSADEDK